MLSRMMMNNMMIDVVHFSVHACNTTKCRRQTTDREIKYKKREQKDDKCGFKIRWLYSDLCSLSLSFSLPLSVLLFGLPILYAWNAYADRWYRLLDSIHTTINILNIGYICSFHQQIWIHVEFFNWYVKLVLQ